MKRRARRFLILAAGVCLLLVAAASQWLPRKTGYHFQPDKELAEFLPFARYGWGAEDLPLGATESATASAQAILMTNDFVHRRYRQGSRQFTVFCAFWRPFAQTAAEVGSHTPDRCWTLAGWTHSGPKRTTEFKTSKGMTWPGERRQFAYQGMVHDVVFWHLRGGRLSGYGMGLRAGLSARAPVLWANLVEGGFAQTEFEQFFVRIHASVPLDELIGEPMFSAVLESLVPIGLVARR